MTVMPEPNTDPLISFMIEQYKRGVIVYFYGCEDESVPMQKAGVVSANQALKTIDALGCETRRALIPLLDHPDIGIRIFAARDLLEIVPERALAVLQAAANAGEFHPRMVALDVIERFNKKNRAEGKSPDA